MLRNRIELSGGRVVQEVTTTAEGVTTETFEAGNQPTVFFVDVIEDNVRTTMWAANDSYETARKVAQELSQKYSLELVDLEGLRFG